MTPLVDVMLVLLVVFMVTAPLIGPSLPLELPAARAASAPAEAPVAAVMLVVEPDGTTSLDGDRLDDAALTLRLAGVAAREPAAEVHLRADRRVPYGRVAELISRVREAGLTRIGFAVEPPPGPADAGADGPR